MYTFYTTLLALTVTIHISTPLPTLKDHKHYDLTTCTGVFISPNEVLTAGHCMEESRGRQWIKTSDGHSYKAILEKAAFSEDLALLHVIDIPDHAYAKLGKTPIITDKIYTVNSGDDYAGTWNEGTVCNFVLTDYGNDPYILHSAVILFGASGSGLFNKRGELVGVNVRVERALSVAVNTDTIRFFLDETHLN